MTGKGNSTKLVGGMLMRIVIIEDDATTRQELAKLLTRYGYDTIQPDHFEDMATELPGFPADLILMDVNLPYENGYELCRRIRDTSRIPVVFVTSRDTSKDELKSIRAGGIDFYSQAI